LVEEHGGGNNDEWKRHRSISRAPCHEDAHAGEHDWAVTGHVAPLLIEFLERLPVVVSACLPLADSCVTLHVPSMLSLLRQNIDHSASFFFFLIHSASICVPGETNKDVACLGLRNFISKSV
jgi:hypothetical protein